MCNLQAHGDGDTVNITLPTQHQLVEGMDGAQALPQGKPSEVPDPGLEVLPQPEHGSALREPETASQSGDEQLPSNSAGSAASRHGGSLYDMIVQVSSIPTASTLVTANESHSVWHAR